MLTAPYCEDEPGPVGTGGGAGAGPEPEIGVIKHGTIQICSYIISDFMLRQISRNPVTFKANIHVSEQPFHVQCLLS